MTLLTCKNLNLSFQKKKQKTTILKEISFSLHKKERVALVGESGSGKSVLGKAIMRLLPSYTSYDKGEIHFDERSLLHLSEKKMRQIRGSEIAMIFQDPMASLNPTMRIQDQIIEGILAHTNSSYSEAEKKALEMLFLVGICDPKKRMKDYPHTLSGGMRQRVAIAMALAMKPKLLIADEPTTALDVTIQAQIIDLITKIQKENEMALLLITHDLSLVAGHSDRIMVMYAGQIVENAPTKELFKNPSHPYTRQLLNALPEIDQQKPLCPIEGTPPDFTSFISGCPFEPRCANALPTCKNNPPPLRKRGKDHIFLCWHGEENHE